MEVSLRSFRIFCRFMRNSSSVTSCRQVSDITGASVKEEVNSALVNAYNADIKAGGAVPVFRRALLFPSRVALQDEVGIYTYAGLHQAASQLSQEISTQLAGDCEKTICYMCGNNASHVIVQWAIWMSGNIAVPLTPLHPPEMLKYFVQDSTASLVICTNEYENILRPLTKDMKKPLLVTGKDKEITAQLYQPNNSFSSKEEVTDVGRSNLWYGEKDALLIYTSGTTSKPKGVVWTHSMLSAQIASLHQAWRYSRQDVVLHALPLHHIHGQLNSMLSTLAVGGRLRMLPSFVPHTVWARLLGMGEREEAKVTVFHGVPAMYARLAADHEKMFQTPKTAEYVKTTLQRMRLMCAGSAPLPESLFHKWEQISGQRLLERYGMSEVGMALSNPYRPISARAVGCVGMPLPGVAARIAINVDGELKPVVTVTAPPIDTKISLEQSSLTSKDTKDTWTTAEVTRHMDTDCQGELLLKGPGVFSRYYNRDRKSDDFTPDGWFRTGDTASFSDNFRILGRTSVDIIKTGGYKVSALQVESAILEHPRVADAAVLGIDDPSYGEVVSAVVVLKDQATMTLQELKEEASKRLAPYQVPRKLLVVKEMPRNVMGKLDKQKIRELYREELKM
ncbi:malonate--CoA ligase ACSF3, mitochondrial [Cydia pomonella]|uniref:malonate--CoA ligase ACSF3, mitochondrial n=1 Tax=Cydia pomonella TaxID=82600 RepID=UPI002ADDA095|nr:malonate--CoA ligase ACSF3, mitochondrial [Cydia pomonella]XP_061723758.1 malonate--CoA ligase ACSF3, mitochondrial [Cydia pomonella]